MQTLARRVWVHFMHDSMYRNSVYLLLNMGTTAAAGFLFWTLCTRFYSTEQVGLATALFGALGLAVSLSNMGMNRTVVRFLGNSKTQAQDLATKLALVAAGGLAVGLGLSFFLDNLGVNHTTGYVVPVFVASVLFMSLKNLFDNIFVALKSASHTLLENSVYNAVKLAMPLLLIPLGFMGIFSAQLVAATVAVLVSLVLLHLKHNYRVTVRPARASLSGKWTFALGSYTADIIGSLPANILPIIVVAKLGPVAGALWYVSMLVVNLLLAVSSSVNQAMFAEISTADPASLGRLVKKAAKAMYGLVALMAAAIVVAAPYILSFFGEEYVAAAPTLRIMAGVALLGVTNYLTGSVLAYYKKTSYLTLVNIINALTVGAYCLLFATDLRGIVTGWILGELTNVVLFVAGCIYVVRRQKQAEAQL